MKVIDLINMKYNKEKMPKHIVVNRMNYFYCDDLKHYIDERKNMMNIDFTNNVLNMPVEIIEDEIDIQSIEELGCPGFWGTDNVIENRKKIDELIQAIKQLDRQINNN